MKALLLVGSPRLRGRSAFLGSALARHLKAQDVEVLSLNLVEQHKDSWQQVAAALADAELIILSAPIYVDTLPAPATAFLEKFADRFAGKNLAALLNCGYPERYHNDAALAVCQQFARQSGCMWLGGLTVGMGGISLGKGVSRSLNKGMEMAAQAMAQGQPIPVKAADYAARPAVPHGAYAYVLNRNFRRINKKHGKAPLDARPYQHEGTEQ